jgi:hypothetical protein
MALSLGLFASGWPEHIRAHPTWVAIVFLIGAGLLAIGFLQSSPKEERGQPDFIGGDNQGHRIVAGRDVIIGDAKIASGIKTQSSPQPISIPGSIPVSTKPASGIELEVQYQWLNLVYELSPGLWRRAQSYDNEYKRMLVVRFTNPLPTRGKPIERELRVLSHIKLQNPARGITEQIPTAYWLGEMGYKVNLGMGNNQEVLLGHIENQRFYSCINPYPYPGLNNDFDVPLRQLGEEKSVLLSDRIVIQVSIIKADTDESIIEQVSFDLFQQMQGGWGVSRAK